MGSEALTGFLIKLAVDSEFAKRWAKAQPDAGKKGEDPRLAFLDQVKGLDEDDKKALLSGKPTDLETQLAVPGTQHTLSTRLGPPSTQHTISAIRPDGGQGSVSQSTMQGPVKITITIESR
jgi:hypothetical protein